MHIFIAFTVILSVNFVKTSQYASHGAVDCSMGSSSCESCHAAYPFCYWCNGECKRYFGKNIANIECRGKVMYERCEQTDKKEPNVEEMLKVISRLKKEQSKENEYSNVGKEILCLYVYVCMYVLFATIKKYIYFQVILKL